MTHTDLARGFEIEIPDGWKISGGLLDWLVNLFEKNAVTAMAPRQEGFARMAVTVRNVDREALKRHLVTYSSETYVSVAGLPATAVRYDRQGCAFRKFSVISEKSFREYLIQFGYDDAWPEFDSIIDRVVKSFRLL